jgi:hypothetical protein
VFKKRLKQNLAQSDEKSSFCHLTARNLEVCAIEAMLRKLVWIERQNFQGWACSECAWAFNSLGPLVGESLDDMKMHYEQQRDKEFTSHVCAEHSRAKKNPG